MIIICGNTKGGIGKSTLATQLALARAIAGRAVLPIDADRRGSARVAMAMRAEGGYQPPLGCVPLPDGRQLRAQLGPLAAQNDDVVIDAGGRDSEALRVARLRSDLLVVPVQPRAVDVWALSEMAELIERAQEAREDDGRPRLNVRAVLNLADPGDNRDTADTLEGFGSLPQFGAHGPVIRRSKAIANAMAHGLAVAELQPRDAEACEEIEQLVGNVFDAMEHANGNY